MFKIVKSFLSKLRCRSLIRRLHKLTVEAYDLNKLMNKSDLPEQAKEQASHCLDLFMAYNVIVNNQK